MFSAIMAILSSAVALIWVRTRKALNPFTLLFGGALYVVFLTFLLTRAW